MPQNLADCKKGAPLSPVRKLFVFWTSLEQLFYYKQMGGVSNWLYLLHVLLIINPWCDRWITLRPSDFRQEFGNPWKDGVMPERSFNDALARLRELGVIQQVDERGGFFSVKVNEKAIFFSPPPAKSCQAEEASGNILPNQAPQPLYTSAFISPQTEYLNSKEFKQEEQQQCVGEKKENFGIELTEKSSPVSPPTQKRAQVSPPTQRPAKVSLPPTDRLVRTELPAGHSRLSFVTSSMKALGYEVDLAGEPVGVVSSLAYLIQESDEDRLNDALGAYHEQRKGVRSPGKFLIKALHFGWVPSAAKLQTAPESPYSQWYPLARDLNLVIGSQDTVDGLVVYLPNAKAVFLAKAMENVPLPWLRDLSLEDRGALKGLIGDIAQGVEVDRDELTRLSVSPSRETLIRVS